MGNYVDVNVADIYVRGDKVYLKLYLTNGELRQLLSRSRRVVVRGIYEGSAVVIPASVVYVGRHVARLGVLDPPLRVYLIERYVSGGDDFVSVDAVCSGGKDPV